MSILVTEYGQDDMRKGEKSFEIREPDEEGYQAVFVHPWSRYRSENRTDNEVFISVGVYNEDGTEPIQTENPVWNIIVNREDFVEGILAVFPELKRSDS